MEPGFPREALADQCWTGVALGHMLVCAGRALPGPVFMRLTPVCVSRSSYDGERRSQDRDFC